jgi:hypothetical protein
MLRSKPRVTLVSETRNSFLRSIIALQSVGTQCRFGTIVSWKEPNLSLMCRKAGSHNGRNPGACQREPFVADHLVIRPERLDALLESAFAVVERHIGVVSVSDTLVLRAERF